MFVLLAILLVSFCGIMGRQIDDDFFEGEVSVIGKDCETFLWIFVVPSLLQALK